ncbi:RHS repeat domain-containing protein, partial [Aquimarina litoralis]|uniref:RHS repeat domain-containing protein n=1 Tax=Aquimarina litoralis TaxID=584605 RepID=UPI001C59CA39
AAPGLDWQAKISGDDHTIKLDRTLNTAADNVVYFKVNYAGGNTLVPTLQKVGNYPANELFVSITKDENWKTSDGNNHTTKEFTDKRGRVILKRTYNSNVAHDTYYVYDDFGNLSYVFPPKVTVDNGISGTELNELGYQYRYDRRNRLVEKKIPGKGWEYIVYNKLDQPVMTQDANQRPRNEWLFTKYDAFGRVAFTGLHLHPGNVSRTTMQGFSDNGNYTQYVTKTSQYIDVANTNIYYSNDAIPTGVHKIYTINYYDDYGFDRDGLNKSTSVYGVVTTNTTKGLATGSKVRVLGTDQWITTVMAYDNKGQVIWTGSRNDYLNTTDIVETLLDFTGKPIKVKTTHTKGSNAAIVTTDTFTYDHMGRVLTQKQQIGSHPEELIVQNNYDELGQLESKKVGNAEQAPLQTVDYKYNVRGWLTDINDVNSIGDDLFTFKINYNATEGRYSIPKLYNGNIAETIWKTANDNTKRAYGYEYDPLNRIKDSYFRYNESLTGASLRSYDVRNINYDKNGNITSLTRYNEMGTSNIMDNLSYQYGSGNKLSKVTDNGNDHVGFLDGTNTNSDYAYDVNGNMTIDRNKGITGITYNHLNLPTSVAINDQARSNTGNISYIYDATGVKQKKIVSGGSSLTVEYAGNYVYQNGQLQFFSTAEGYVEPVFASNGVAISSFDYIYQYKDHLGNIRLSYADNNNDGNIDVIPGSATSEILEENNYYPFGLQHKGYNTQITSSNAALKYKYNGKELNEELGINWHDYGARNYDATLGRWMNLDPLAENYYVISPYTYTANNPILFLDPDGKRIKYFNDPNKTRKENRQARRAVRKELRSLKKRSSIARKHINRLKRSKHTFTIKIVGSNNRNRNTTDPDNRQDAQDPEKGSGGVIYYNPGTFSIAPDTNSEGYPEIYPETALLEEIVHASRSVSGEMTLTESGNQIKDRPELNIEGNVKEEIATNRIVNNVRNQLSQPIRVTYTFPATRVNPQDGSLDFSQGSPTVKVVVPINNPNKYKVIKKK